VGSWSEYVALVLTGHAQTCLLHASHFSTRASNSSANESRAGRKCRRVRPTATVARRKDQCTATPLPVSGAKPRATTVCLTGRPVWHNEGQDKFGWHHMMPPGPVAGVPYRHLIYGPESSNKRTCLRISRNSRKTPFSCDNA
jgi:hypothetical protein